MDSWSFDDPKNFVDYSKPQNNLKSSWFHGNSILGVFLLLFTLLPILILKTLQATPTSPNVLGEQDQINKCLKQELGSYLLPTGKIIDCPGIYPPCSPLSNLIPGSICKLTPSDQISQDVLPGEERSKICKIAAPVPLPGVGINPLTGRSGPIISNFIQPVVPTICTGNESKECDSTQTFSDGEVCFQEVVDDTKTSRPPTEENCPEGEICLPQSLDEYLKHLAYKELIGDLLSQGGTALCAVFCNPCLYKDCSDYNSAPVPHTESCPPGTYQAGVICYDSISGEEVGRVAEIIDIGMGDTIAVDTIGHTLRRYAPQYMPYNYYGIQKIQQDDRSRRKCDGKQVVDAYWMQAIDQRTSLPKRTYNIYWVEPGPIGPADRAKLARRFGRVFQDFINLTDTAWSPSHVCLSYSPSTDFGAVFRSPNTITYTEWFLSHPDSYQSYVLMHEITHFYDFKNLFFIDQRPQHLLSLLEGRAQVAAFLYVRGEPKERYQKLEYDLSNETHALGWRNFSKPMLVQGLKPYNPAIQPTLNSLYGFVRYPQYISDQNLADVLRRAIIVKWSEIIRNVFGSKHIDLTATNVTDTSVSLSWNNPQEVLGTRIVQSQSGESEGSIIESENLRVDKVTSNSVSVSWDADPGADHYFLDIINQDIDVVKDSSQNNIVASIKIDNPQTTTFTYNNLSPRTTYALHLIACKISQVTTCDSPSPYVPRYAAIKTAAQGTKGASPTCTISYGNVNPTDLYQQGGACIYSQDPRLYDEKRPNDDQSMLSVKNDPNDTSVDCFKGTCVNNPSSTDPDKQYCSFNKNCQFIPDKSLVEHSDCRPNEFSLAEKLRELKSIKTNSNQALIENLNPNTLYLFELTCDTPLGSKQSGLAQRPFQNSSYVLGESLTQGTSQGSPALAGTVAIKTLAQGAANQLAQQNQAGGSGALGPDAAGLPQLQQLGVRIINISVGMAAIVLTVMLVIAGIRFILSAGEQEPLQLARKTATYAIVGFILLAVVWLILRLITTFTGVDVTQFCLGFRPYCLI